MTTDDGGEVGPCQSGTESIRGSYDVVFDKCLRALKKIEAQVKTSNKDSGSITAKMSMTWKSFGEELEVSLAMENDEQVKVTFSSAPSLKKTLIDYGKGRQNVNSFFEALKF